MVEYFDIIDKYGNLTGEIVSREEAHNKVCLPFIDFKSIFLNSSFTGNFSVSNFKLPKYIVFCIPKLINLY